MKIFSFLDTKELEKFAEGLAEDLARRFPPTSEARTDPGARKQIMDIVDSLAAQAVRYQQENSLGVYKKAKLGNTFQWKLMELGYSKEFAEGVTQELVTRVAAN